MTKKSSTPTILALVATILLSSLANSAWARGNCPVETPAWDGKNCVACPLCTPAWDGKKCLPCPADKPAWDGKQCKSCAWPYPVFFPCSGKCYSCPPATPAWDGKSCIACAYPTPVLNLKTGACEACPPATPRFNTSTKQCEACPKPQVWSADGYCDCVGKYPVGDKCEDSCPPATPAWNLNEDGKCTACPTDKPWWNTESDESEGGACEACPSDTPLWDPQGGNEKVGACVKCPEKTPRYNKETKSCEACPDKQVWDSEAGYCDCKVADGKPTLFPVDDKCLPSCPLATPAWDKKEGKCMVCSTDYPLWNPKGGEGEKGECQECPEDAPNWDGTKCVACTDALPNWDESKKVCAPPCPTDKPAWDGKEGKCTPCPEGQTYASDGGCGCWETGKEYYDEDAKVCKACSEAFSNTYPYWDSSAKDGEGDCTQCPEQTMWDGKICASCPTGAQWTSVKPTDQGRCITGDTSVEFWDSTKERFRPLACCADGKVRTDCSVVRWSAMLLKYAPYNADPKGEKGYWGCGLGFNKMNLGNGRDICVPEDVDMSKASGIAGIPANHWSLEIIGCPWYLALGVPLMLMAFFVALGFFWGRRHLQSLRNDLRDADTVCEDRMRWVSALQSQIEGLGQTPVTMPPQTRR